MGFERFQNDLLAALEAGVPLEIGETSIVWLTRSKLNRLGESTRGQLKSSLTPETLAELSSKQGELPNRYLAAMRTFAQTGSMSPVLDGLTNRVTSKRRVNRILRRVFIYLALLVIAALLGLLIFTSNVAPVIEEMRADTFLNSISKPLGPDAADASLWLPTLMWVFVGILALMLVWMLFGGVTQATMWLGGRNFVRSCCAATAFRIAQLLVRNGMKVEQAVEVSCDLAGVDIIGRREFQGLKEKEKESTQHIDHSETDFRSMSNYMLTLAEQRLKRMQLMIPVLLIALVGGTVCLAYCVSVFSPIISLLWDLKFAGAN